MTRKKINDVRIRLVNNDGTNMLNCPKCNASLLEKGALNVTVSDGDRLNPEVDTIEVTVKSDGFLSSEDDDGYEFDHGTECETKCAKCDAILNGHFSTSHN